MKRTVLRAAAACMAIAAIVAAAAAQSLVDNSKGRASGQEEKDLLDIQWMLVGHRSSGASMSMLAVSFDGKTMVSGGNLDLTLKVWDIERHVLKRTIVCRDLKQIAYVDINLDGSKVLAGSIKTIAVYDVAAGKRLHRMDCNYMVKDAVFTAYDTLAIRDTGGTVTIQDPKSARKIATVAQEKRLLRLPISPDRKYLFGVSLEARQSVAGSAVVDSNEQSATFDWIDVSSGYRRGYSVVVGNSKPDPTYWVCLKDNILVTFDVETKELLFVPYQKDYILVGPQVQYIEHLSKIVPSADGGTYMVLQWDQANRQAVATISETESSSLYAVLAGITYIDEELASSRYQSVSLALGPLGVYIFAGNSEYSGGMNVARPPIIELWGQNGKRTRGYLDNGSSICDLVLSEDGKLFAASTTEGRVKIYDRSTGAFIRFLDCPRVFWQGQMIPSPMQDLVIGKDFVAGASPGPHVFVRGLDNNEIKSKHLIDPNTGWSDTPVMCGYDNGNKILVTTPRSKLGLRLMETVTGKLLRTYEPKVALRKVCRAGEYVIGITGSTLYIWNIETGELKNKLENDASTFSAVAFNKNRVYAGEDDGTISCFDLLSGKLIKEFKGHEAPIIALAVSPDGRTLISRSNDSREDFPFRVWDVETCRLLHKYDEEIGPMEKVFLSGNSIRFTPDGKYFLFSRGDGSIVYVKLDLSPPKEEPNELDKPRALHIEQR